MKIKNPTQAKLGWGTLKSELSLRHPPPGYQLEFY